MPDWYPVIKACRLYNISIYEAAELPDAMLAIAAEYDALEAEIRGMK